LDIDPSLLGTHKIIYKSSTFCQARCLWPTGHLSEFPHFCGTVAIAGPGPEMIAACGACYPQFKKRQRYYNVA